MQDEGDLLFYGWLACTGTARIRKIAPLQTPCGDDNTVTATHGDRHHEEMP